MLVLILILMLAAFQVTLFDYLVNNPDYYQLDKMVWETDEFRQMALGDLIVQEPVLDAETIAALMVEKDYDLTDLTELAPKGEAIAAKKPAAFQKLIHAYQTVFSDLKYFPIPQMTADGTKDVCYENGWMDPRSYGGDRGHEGCDIMGGEYPSGFYPVISMSDGVVEKCGWLEQGGWRLGIRTPGGLYVYYAHLYGYAKEWKEGDIISAGTLLGFMGDTGYSKIEGTTGNFPVHLHIGLYLRTDNYEELSVNPYWILRYLEQYRLNCLGKTMHIAHIIFKGDMIK